MSSTPFQTLDKMGFRGPVVDRETIQRQRNLKNGWGLDLVGHPLLKLPLTASKLHWTAESQKKILAGCTTAPVLEATEESNPSAKTTPFLP